MADLSPMFPFWEELDQLAGKTILEAWTDDLEPRLLLVFTDRTAAIVEEDTSGCYYAGETGGMMVAEPSEDEKAKAVEIWESRHRPTDGSPNGPNWHLDASGRMVPNE